MSFDRQAEATLLVKPLAACPRGATCPGCIRIAAKALSLARDAALEEIATSYEKDAAKSGDPEHWLAIAADVRRLAAT